MGAKDRVSISYTMIGENSWEWLGMPDSEYRHPHYILNTIQVK